MYDVTMRNYIISLWQGYTHWSIYAIFCPGGLIRATYASPNWVIFVACVMSNFYLKQCLFIVPLTLGIKLQWNVKRNTTIFININAFEYFVSKVTAILC